MYKKKCPKCKVVKTREGFGLDNRRTDKMQCWCRECTNNSKRYFYRTEKGVLSSIYNSQKNSSIKRNHHQPMYTREQLFSWATSQKIFNELYNQWVASGFETSKRPSVDRLDESKGYSFDNIQLMTWGENSYKDKVRQMIKVNQVKDGKIINTFNSIRGAGRETGICQSDIVKCCKGKQSMAGGFIWEYCLCEG